MATALHPPRTDTGPNVHVNVYPRAIMTDLDFKDNRYPSLASQTRYNQHPNAMIPGPSDRSNWGTHPTANEGVGRNADPGVIPVAAAMTSGWVADRYDPQAHTRDGSDRQSLQSSQSRSQEPQRSVVSYALPPGARRVVERYSLDDNVQLIPSRASEEETRATPADSTQDLVAKSSGAPQVVRQDIPSLSPNQNPTFQERPLSTMIPPTPRHPALPAAGVGGPSNSNFSPSRLPLSASPAYNPPISPKPRASAQLPTYITQTTTPNPMNTVYTPAPQLPQEEVCVECAMRDQDMADVDVSSPGVWERESDVLFEELVRREHEDALNGIVTPADSTRPKSKGGRLTEKNLKIWLSIVRLIHSLLYPTFLTDLVGANNRILENLLHDSRR